MPAQRAASSSDLNLSVHCDAFALGEQEERERSDSSMAKRGLSEERNRIRDRLNALERQKVRIYPSSQVQRIAAIPFLPARRTPG